MGCSNLCSCQFNWPIDTQGSKRDPVNSEKAWLDFAVRFLSREAVGKGRGQVTVWNAACEPSWWNSEVGLPWKNPTSNPKDTKEDLQQKYDALEKHLKKEGRFPQELEEEARLWSEGKYKELFLLTSLTSLRGKVTGVHSSVIDAASKTEELKAEINQLLLQDIKICLKSTLTALENFSCKNTTRNNWKRPYGMADDVAPVTKIQKLDVSNKKLTSPDTSRPFCEKKKIGNISENPATVTTISAFSERLLAKQRKLKENISSIKKNKMSSNIPQVTTTPVTMNNELVPSTIESEIVNPTPQPLTVVMQSSPQPITVAMQSSPLYVNISQEELNQLFKGNPVPLDESENGRNVLLSYSDVPTTQNSSGNHAVLSPPNNMYFESHISTPLLEIPISDMTDSLGEEIHIESDDLDFDFLEAIDFQANSPLMTPNLNNKVLSGYTSSCLSSPIDSLLNETSDPSPQLNLAEVTTHMNKTVDIDRVLSGESVISDHSVGHSHDSSHNISDHGHSHESSHNISDHGYGSDEGTLDLNSLYSPQEQTQLWGEDASSLFDGFMTGLDLL